MGKDHLTEEKISRERLKLLYKSLFSGQIGILFCVLILTTSLWSVVPRLTLIIWTSVQLLIICYRLIIRHYFYSQIDSNDFSIHKWQYYFFVGVVLTALAWGGAGIFLFTAESYLHQEVLIILLVGMTATSIGTLSPSLKAISFYIPTILIPVIIQLILIGNNVSVSVGALITLYMGIMLLSGKRFNATINENFLLRFEAEEKEHALFESEEKYRLLFENSEDAMWLIQDNFFIMANNAAVHLLEMENADELLKYNSTILSPHFQEDGTLSSLRVDEYLKQVLTEGYLRIDWLGKTLTNRLIPLDISLTRVPFKGKDAIFCIGRDISKAKQFQKQLIAAQENADKANKAKSEFLATMSHEIRTPMNAVIGMTSLMLDEPLDEEQYKRAITVKNSAESLLVIINDILDFSKIEAGKLDLESVDFDLENLFDDLATLFKYKLQEKQLSFESSFNSNKSNWYKADPGRIRQILINIIDNAIKFTKDGGVSICCDVVEKQEHKTLLKFTIKDTGIGLNKEQQLKLFQPFTQADSSTTRKYGGTGLGLTICKQLTELMDGEIGVISEPEKGSTFWFTTTLAEANGQQEIKSIRGSKKFKGKILVVDDNVTNQIIAKSMLSKLGVEVYVVDNGVEAILALKVEDYDLVFMDCQMPIMDGYEATRNIRDPHSRVKNNEIPVIAMTANAMQGDREKSLESGMNEHLTKPINPLMLKNALDKWLPFKNEE